MYIHCNVQMDKQPRILKEIRFHYMVSSKIVFIFATLIQVILILVLKLILLNTALNLLDMF